MRYAHGCVELGEPSIFFWKNLGFRSNQAVRDIWKTFFQPPEVCELCYELPMTRLRQGARSAFQIVSSSYM